MKTKENNSIGIVLRSQKRLLIALICLFGNALHGQNYLGVGFHLTPTIYLENTQNPYVITTPQPGLAGSLTYKKEWAYRKRQKWYLEAGLDLQGLRYYQVDYHGDSSTIWTDFVNAHTGFPSVLVGGGHSFNFGKANNEFSVGLEALYLLEQDLGEIYSASFGILNNPMTDATFPMYLRLNLAYNRALGLFNLVPGQLQLYTSLSAQKLTKGTQYIRNVPEGGPYKSGVYHVNNSELGIKLFAGLNKKTRKTQPGNTPQNSLLAQSERKLRYRISIAGQLYAPSRTVFHIPQVDSFSVKGRKAILIPQFGVVVAFPIRRNDLWSTVVGLGIGPRVATMVFKSDGRFTANKLPVGFEHDLTIGHYGIASLGLSRQSAMKHLMLAHTLSASVVLPLEHESAYLGVPETSDEPELPPYEHPVLEGRIDYQYGREPVLFGVEYNPEIFFKLPKSFFLALGLVGNYSYGVMAQGQFRVFNGQTTYYGALLQKFSKIGVTVRVGLER